MSETTPEYSQKSRNCCVEENKVAVHKGHLTDHTGQLHEITFDYCCVCGNYKVEDIE